MNLLTLSEDQQAAFEAFVSFILSPYDYVFTLSGYSGTGKSTLVAYLIDKLPNIMQTRRLVDPNASDWIVQLTATTNQAADALSQLSGSDVRTIHSFLGLRVSTDYKSGKTTLIPRDRQDVKSGYLIFIDEASYIDSALLQLIFQQTDRCKIVFMGDRAQLTPVMSADTPVFKANFPGAHLSKVVRQADGNPIIELATLCRNTVETGDWFNFKPDGHHVQWLTREHFEEAIKQEFLRPDWCFRDSKVLAWTNKTVIMYNQAIRDLVQGDPHLQIGDYAVCNKFMKAGSHTIKTDEMVRISHISDEVMELEVAGRMIEINGNHTFFMPKTLEARKERIKQAKAVEDYSALARIDQFWIDLRSAFACTINKSQGSTYDMVFIDLDDIKKCHNGNQVARMLYVGISRARFKVLMTGDLV